MEGRINAIVTGGTCGLGKALVKTLLKNGCNVATFGRRPDLVRTLIEEVGNASLFAESCDLTNLEQVSSFLRKATIAFGAQDLIILNAGELGPTPLKSVKENSILYFRLVFESFHCVWIGFVACMRHHAEESVLGVYSHKMSVFLMHPGDIVAYEL